MRSHQTPGRQPLSVPLTSSKLTIIFSVEHFSFILEELDMYALPFCRSILTSNSTTAFITLFYNFDFPLLDYKHLAIGIFFALFGGTVIHYWSLFHPIFLG